MRSYFLFDWVIRERLRKLSRFFFGASEEFVPDKPLLDAASTGIALRSWLLSVKDSGWRQALLYAMTDLGQNEIERRPPIAYLMGNWLSTS